MPQPGVSGKTPDESKQQAILDIQRLQSGEDFDPEFVDESYVKVLAEFVQSPGFQDLDDEIKGKFSEYVGKLRGALNSQAVQSPQAPQMPQQQPVSNAGQVL